jgi:phosphonoacetate hydrolase
MTLWRRVILALAFLLTAHPVAGASTFDGLRVYIVLIDGLGASLLSANLTPTLWRLAHRGTFYPHGRAVMPTLTNPNHASIMTGVYPQAHGIVANRWLDGEIGQATAARAVETRTIFTAAAMSAERPRTAGIFGKASSRGSSRTARRSGRRIIWADPQEEAGSDLRTMDEMLRTIGAEDPAFAFVALGDLDRRAHAFGPDSPGSARGACRRRPGGRPAWRRFSRSASSGQSRS